MEVKALTKFARMSDKKVREIAREIQGRNAANLTIKSAIVNQGVAFRRFRPVARGSAHPIRKRTSHILVVLSDQK